MSRTLRVTTALSAIATAGLMAGCASPGVRVSGGFANPGDGRNIGTATRAQLALQKGDHASAVSLAEQAVGNSPNDAGFRGLLGNAYLSAGRFASAEAAFRDSLALLPNQPRTALRMVLAQIAQGKTGEALAQLDALRGQADLADIGLATALAGQPGNAIAMLDEAARQPQADGRTRQNLALAYALAGDWQNARVVAAQDVPGDQLEGRLAAWMQMVTPQNSTSQVAALIGVTPASRDPGQPVRLALRTTEPRMATAATAPAPAPAPAPAMAEQAAVTDPGLATPPAAETSQMAEAVPVVEIAPAVDVAQTLDAIRSEPVRASGQLPNVSELRRSAAQRFAQSGVVVQLGAYDSPATMRAGWAKLSKRHAQLSRFTPSSARFQAPIGLVYRLSVAGFENNAEARRMCMELKASGAACFVRNVAGDTPIRFAAR